jgi:hypothetical protein
VKGDPATGQGGIKDLVQTPQATSVDSKQLC